MEKSILIVNILVRPVISEGVVVVKGDRTSEAFELPNTNNTSRTQHR